MKILLAEDSDANQQLALGVLRKWGHTLTIANNGHEAVAAFERDTYDVILMDVQMPEMDGLQATALIREQEQQRGRHVPIIAMTANAMKGDREECVEAGMDEYVTKPIRWTELRQALDRVVPRTSKSDVPDEALPMTSQENVSSAGEQIADGTVTQGEMIGHPTTHTEPQEWVL